MGDWVMTRSTKLKLGAAFVVFIFFAATFFKNWGTAVSENLLEKYKPEVGALQKKPELAKVKCKAIVTKLKSHLSELAKSKDKLQVPLAYKLIADCSFASGEYSESASFYKKLVEFEPNAGTWHAKLAESYLKAGDAGEALAPSILATQLAPRDFRIRRLNARILAELGLRNRAIAAYAEAIRIAPYKMIEPTKAELQKVLSETELRSDQPVSAGNH